MLGRKDWRLARITDVLVPRVRGVAYTSARTQSPGDRHRCGSIFLTDAQFRDTQTAKPPAFGKPTALPCPPYVPFSWTAVVGCRTSGEGDAVISPFVPRF